MWYVQKDKLCFLKKKKKTFSSSADIFTHLLLFLSSQETSHWVYLLTDPSGSQQRGEHPLWVFVLLVGYKHQRKKGREHSDTVCHVLTCESDRPLQIKPGWAMSPASRGITKNLFWHVSIYHRLQGPVWAHLDKLFAIAAPQGMKTQGKLNRDSTLSSSCPTSATEAFTVINNLRHCIKQFKSPLQSCIKN